MAKGFVFGKKKEQKEQGGQPMCSPRTTSIKQKDTTKLFCPPQFALPNRRTLTQPQEKEKQKEREKERKREKKRTKEAKQKKKKEKKEPPNPQRGKKEQKQKESEKRNF